MEQSINNKYELNMLLQSAHFNEYFDMEYGVMKLVLKWNYKKDFDDQGIENFIEIQGSFNKVIHSMKAIV